MRERQTRRSYVNEKRDIYIDTSVHVKRSMHTRCCTRIVSTAVAVAAAGYGIVCINSSNNLPAAVAAAGECAAAAAPTGFTVSFRRSSASGAVVAVAAASRSKGGNNLA